MAQCGRKIGQWNRSQKNPIYTVSWCLRRGQEDTNRGHTNANHCRASDVLGQLLWKREEVGKAWRKWTLCTAVRNAVILENNMEAPEIMWTGPAVCSGYRQLKMMRSPPHKNLSMLTLISEQNSSDREAMFTRSRQRAVFLRMAFGGYH